MIELVRIFNGEMGLSQKFSLLEPPAPSFNSGVRSPDGANMEWIGPFLIGILILGGILQLFWAFTISALAQKTEQNEFMQVIAWIPLLQIAPTLKAGGGSVVRFLIGMIALIAGNGALLAMAAFLGDGFGRGVAVLGLVLTGLICLVYFGRIACNTAIARDLPGWMGLLLFVPLLNFFVYPYFAFHDGWIGPNKIGLAIGSVLVLSGMAPSFQIVRLMNENGGVSPAVLMAMTNTDFVKLTEGDLRPLEFSVQSGDPKSSALSSIRSESVQSEKDTIRALYRLKAQFDTLGALATHENLRLDDDHRVRASDLIQTIHADLEAQRLMLDGSTYSELATHLLDIEARVHAQRPATASQKSQFAPAALDPSYRAKSLVRSEPTAPPVRPYPVHASNECPAGTEPNIRKDGRFEEEWCQQLSAFGGLRHGWYARYDEEGRPESMGRYNNGLRVGVWTRFFSTGEVRAQAEFREGMQHGWVLTFNQLGERTRSARYEDGSPVLDQ